METEKPALTPTRLSQAVGISVPYASQIISGDRVPPQATALRIFRATGERFGALKGATEAEIKVLEKFQGAA